MANTTNFGWETPDDTDLVKDGAAAIRTLGQAIDTSLADLEGGTSGQILAKNSNTDMDFVWITNDVGDITEVVAGTGLSGGGSSGSVTLTNTVATEFDAKGDLVVGTGADTFDKLSAGTNDHRLVAASGETTGLKYVSDTQNTVIDAEGDLLIGDAADALQRLAIGSNAQVLTVDTTVDGKIKWATPAGGGALTLIHTETLSAVGSVNIDSKFTSTYVNYLILANLEQSTSNSVIIQYRSASSTITTGYKTSFWYTEYTSNTWNVVSSASATNLASISSNTDRSLIALTVGDPETSEYTKGQAMFTDNTYNIGYNSVYPQTTAIDGIRFSTSTGTMTGTVRIYGYSNS
jgi:hypothetical protein